MKSDLKQMRRRLFQLSLLTIAISLVSLLWPVADDPLIPVRARNGKWGLINADGRVVIEPEWDDIDLPDEDGMILVEKNKEVSWIGRDGEVRAPAEWDISSSTPFPPEPTYDSKGMAPVMKYGKWGWINRSGKEVIPFVWDRVSPFEPCGTAAVFNSADRQGRIDRLGNLVVPVTWFKVSAFNEADLAFARSYFSRRVLIGRDGTELGEVAWDSDWEFDAHGLSVARKAPLDPPRYGFVDLQGNVVIPMVWEMVGAFNSHGMAAVKDQSGLWGWINTEGAVVIEPQWQETMGFDDKGMAPVKSGKKWGWIDRKGEWVIEPQWIEVSPFDAKDMAQITAKNGENAFINRNGLKLFSLANQHGFSGKFDSRDRMPIYSSSSNFYQIVVSGYVDRTGTIRVEPPDSDWSGDATRSERSGYYHFWKFEPPNWIESAWDRVTGWLGTGGTGTGAVYRYRIYDAEGKLVWNNSAARFETKCCIALGIALLLALLTRPKRKVMPIEK